jgi:hypothetical protein
MKHLSWYVTALRRARLTDNLNTFALMVFEAVLYGQSDKRNRHGWPHMRGG